MTDKLWNQELKITQTADGSNTIYNAQIGENYHSRHGALQESKHVFIDSGLRFWLSSTGRSRPCLQDVGRELNEEVTLANFEAWDPAIPVTAPTIAEVAILEVGFGTGLNYLLSADFCSNQKIDLHYAGIEAYPLTVEMIGQTRYEQYVSSEVWHGFIANYQRALMATVTINDYCQLQIAHCELLNFQSVNQYDLIYFDAFAAVHQPEMWAEPAIKHILSFLKPSGVFVTYAITGNLKRLLKSLGCKVEKAPGAPGKREMLRAVKC